MGVAAETAAAEAMLAARQGDERFRCIAMGAEQRRRDIGIRSLRTGRRWQDPTPWVGGVKPFLIQKLSSQFRGAGPPALTSAAWAADFNEVKAIGGDGVVTPSTRTSTQTYVARWWQNNPAASSTKSPAS